MHQIQEQLQINLLQQTQLMQNQGDKSSSPQTAGGGGKSSPSLQQLQIQQQQLISQLQLLQQRLLMVIKKVYLERQIKMDVASILSFSPLYPHSSHNLATITTTMINLVRRTDPQI